MRCDAAWFRATFLEDTCPADLSAADDIWSYVKVNPDPDPDLDPSLNLNPNPNPDPNPDQVPPRGGRHLE